MKPGNQSVIEGRELVTRDIPVHKNFLGRHHFTIQFGYQGRLFRDGAFDRDLGPGPHSWWSLFHKYTVSVVDSRVHLIGDNSTDPNDRIESYGTIAGPPGEDGQPTPPCRVVVPLSISLQLADIEAHLTTARPFGTLIAMIIHHATLSIGQWRYDQLNGWVRQLKDDLERYLQLNSVRRTGLQVLEVFVGEPKGASQEDERRLKMFQLATDIKLQSARLQAQLQANIQTAGARRQEADILGISPLLQELLKIPGGVDIIKGDMELRRVAIAAGILTGPNATIIPVGPPGSGEIPGTYIAPSPSTGTTGAIPALPGGARSSPDWPTQPSWDGSGPFTTPAGTSGPTTPQGNTQPPPRPSGSVSMPGYGSPTPPSMSPGDGQLDMARISQERSLFPANLYEIKEGKSIIDDHAGQPTHGYQFILIAKGGDPNNRLTITFDLVPGFPQNPPIVWVKWGQAKFARYGGKAIRDWSEQTWLNNVLQEIVASPLP
jgi:hypothetical protein